MDAPGLLYVVVFLGSATLTLAVTPPAGRLAERFDLLDVPGGHKDHAAPVPYLGGLAIALAFAVAAVVAVLTLPVTPDAAEVVVILGAAAVLSGVGLLDDLRDVNVWVKLVFQVVAAVAVWLVGAGVQLFPVEAFNVAITLVWVVGITNAFNLLDNMDGLSAGLAAIAGLSFFTIAALEGQFLVAALAISLAGAMLGFLRHNFHPARIHMGDSGSLFAGFLLAVIGVKLRFDAPMQVTFSVPILVLGVAIFDTALVTISRIRHGLSPVTPGRDHVSHRLVSVGIPVPAAVGLIYGAAIALGWLATAVARVELVTGYLLMGLVLAVGVALFLLLGAVPVYENSRGRRIVVRSLPPKTEADDREHMT